VSSDGTGENYSGVSTPVIEIVTEMAPSALTAIGPDTELVAELGFDSLGLLELLAALEDELKLPPIDDGQLVEIRRVADLERIVDVARAASAAEGRPS
jgi:acyl carrier protein